MFKALEMQTPLENDLLSSLTPEEHARLRPNIRHVTLPIGHVLYERGDRVDYAYFPTTCVVSSLYIMRSGSVAEIAIVGNEGVVGVSSFLGGSTIAHQVVTQISGHAFKISSKVLQEEFARGGSFQHALLRYTQAFITQVSQTAVCNRLHSLEQRLCRWLLLCHDRVAKGSEILMTQELIAHMLGGRRESVTVAAGRLQDAGLIHYSRAHIRILDRAALEAAACECYRVVEDEVNCLFRKRQAHALGQQTSNRGAYGGVL
jgi:CRP-like cAMP-binding protein